MRRIIIYIIVLILLFILVACAYQFAANFTYTRHITLPPSLLASSSTDIVASSTDADDSMSVFGQTNPSLYDPLLAIVDKTSWQTYTSNNRAFSIQYPSDLTVVNDPQGRLVLSVPKDRYFHWPLLDDVTITVSATSSCPVALSTPEHGAPDAVEVNSYSFIHTAGADAAAGNVYRESAYDYARSSLCYHIDLLDHGANGAGLYVGDQSLIARYDAQHQADINAVLTVFAGIVNSFRLVL